MSIETWLDEQGVSLRFVISDARLNLKESHGEQASRSVGIGLKLERGEDIRLPDKRSLKNVVWSMYLVESTEFNGNATKQGAIGFVSHFDETRTDNGIRPEECHLSAALKIDKFSALLEAIRSVRLPVSVAVRVRGMEYGWEPDGSGKEWDLMATPNPSIIEVGFNFPLLVSHSNSTSDDSEHINHLPASTADIQALKNTVIEQFSVLRNYAWKVLVYLLIPAMVFWLIRGK